jgi:hypothetical protein
VLLRQVPWRTVLGWLGLLVAAVVVVVAGVYARIGLDRQA